MSVTLTVTLPMTLRLTVTLRMTVTLTVIVTLIVILTITWTDISFIPEGVVYLLSYQAIKYSAPSRLPSRLVLRNADAGLTRQRSPNAK